MKFKSLRNLCECTQRDIAVKERNERDLQVRCDKTRKCISHFSISDHRAA